MPVTFATPAEPAAVGVHHGTAAAGNIEAVTAAIGHMTDVLDGAQGHERILLRAAAGAGKSHALKRMVDEALQHRRCARVGVTAFANKQLWPLARDLGTALGRDKVCLYVSKARFAEVPQDVLDATTVTDDYTSVPHTAGVIVVTSHLLRTMAWRLRNRVGSAYNGTALFDILFVDEAWQMPLHLYRDIERTAPLSVGVGDVGQLPPLDPNQNPWRGDPGYNPYRAWPTQYEDEHKTRVIELPAVFRPTAAQLGLWQAFYSEWDALDCVAAPGDRTVETPPLAGIAADIWAQVVSGVPTLVEVENLADPDAADIDLPLLRVVEGLLDALLAGGFTLRHVMYDSAGVPVGERVVDSMTPADDAYIAVLTTRNQATDDSQEMVDRLIARHSLPDGVLVASTVDSWQGRTNALTVAVHPLSGASRLDDFNSAFGRLAVACTRATHGLLLVARSGLDELLATAAPRPGTPLGEPGTRQLPRQTHERILRTFARGVLVGSA